ncbi:hypothetical protein VKI21_12130 [Cyanobacterium aponinum UTEX 3222]|uniref:hypothetical protein n=1 Tax=Cyanobacterium aponinum TaxID=379064 RepID=UPI00308C9642|nr:hypothetical protein VKI21_12130 [Cyanobacterium aponinum UTEX 3222]
MNWNFSPRILIQGIDQDCAQEYLQQFDGHRKDIVAGITDQNLDFTFDGIPVFSLITDAFIEGAATPSASEKEMTTSLIFSHPYLVLNAVYEAITAQIKQIVIYSESVPPLDLFKIYQKAKLKDVKILGTSQGGILIPEEYYCGLNYGNIFQKGNIAMINYADQIIAVTIAQYLQKFDLGFSKVINVGNNLLSQIDWDLWLKMLDEDKNTEVILINLGEISTKETKNLATSIEKISKPVIIYLLDKNHLKSKINNNKAKVISDQIFNNLYTANSSELIKEYVQNSKGIITEDYQAISELLISQ